MSKYLNDALLESIYIITKNYSIKFETIKILNSK
jgi:hypothetical protein